VIENFFDTNLGLTKMSGHRMKCMELCCHCNASICCCGQDVVSALWNIHIYFMHSLLFVHPNNHNW